MTLLLDLGPGDEIYYIIPAFLLLLFFGIIFAIRSFVKLRNKNRRDALEDKLRADAAQLERDLKMQEMENKKFIV